MQSPGEESCPLRVRFLMASQRCLWGMQKNIANSLTESSRSGREVRERYGLGSYPVVGFVGRNVANKGAGTLIRAMRKVWTVRPEVRLLMAGPRPSVDRELDPLMRNLTEFEMQRIVSINKFADEEKASIYDAMDVFALPSTSESFGIAYLEAWMCGKPVIGARIGPTQCVIEEGMDGLLVPLKDADDTARAILDLLGDADQRERMGRRGHAKTVAKFTWEKVTDSVERLFLEIASKRAVTGEACKGAGKTS